MRVLIAGAGPVGLFAAIRLTGFSIPVTLVERNASVGDDIRASTFHPPTLEMMEPYGITEEMVAAIGEPEIIDTSRDARLARSYDIGLVEPNIQVIDVDLLGERHLKLQHTMHDRIPLAEKSRAAVLEQIRKLWGYDVSLTGIDAGTDEVLYDAETAGGDGG